MAESFRSKLVGHCGLAAFTFLVAGHSIAEIARDALFLVHLPASRLPWVYLGIALTTFLVYRIQSRRHSRHPRRQFAFTMIFGAVGYAAFSVAAFRASDALFYGLYIWSAAFMSLASLQFWLLMSSVYRIDQAKRLFARIGAGGAFGALVGSLAARGLVEVVPEEFLLLTTAACFAVVVMIARVGLPAVTAVAEPEGGLQGFSGLGKNTAKYARGLVLLVVLTGVAATLVDWLFKDQVSAVMAAEDLDEFFAGFYSVATGIGLFVQLVLTGFLVRWIGVGRLVFGLPALFLVALGAIVAWPVMLNVILIKLFDGSLRNSLHRTLMELLYFPLSISVRRRVKFRADVIGQRLGQALASVGLLGLVAVGTGVQAMGVIVFAVVLLWAATAWRLRRLYPAMFREALVTGRLRVRPNQPELDMHSLEQIVATLNSPDDHEVLAALELLQELDKAHLVPALILYHPSREVVLSALAIFGRSGRRDFVPVAERLLARADHDVRAAALRAIYRVQPQQISLRAYLEDRDPVVATTAMAGLVAIEQLPHDECRSRVQAIVEGEDVASKVALARAVAMQPSAVFKPALTKLANEPDDTLQIAVAEALRVLPDVHNVTPLLQIMRNRRARGAAIDAIAAIGDAALPALAAALDDLTQPKRVRRALPRIIAHFSPQRAVEVLLPRLEAEPSGPVRFKILRALGRVVADHTDVEIDRARVGRLIAEEVELLRALLGWEAAFEHLFGDPPEASAEHLLQHVLADKRTETIERLFRLQGILHPQEDFETLHQAVSGNDESVRQNALELLGYILSPDVHKLLVQVLSTAPLAQRWAAIGGDALPEEASELFAQMLNAKSGAVRALTIHLVMERGVVALLPRVEDAVAGLEGALAEFACDALGALRAQAHEQEDA